MKNDVYLVVEPMQIIAADLAMNVQDYDPSALVLTAHSPEAAYALLDSCTSVRLAFVHSDPDTFNSSRLAQALYRLGAQIAFTGDAAERKSDGIWVLQMPFCGQTIATFLQNTERSQKAA